MEILDRNDCSGYLDISLKIVDNKQQQQYFSSAMTEESKLAEADRAVRAGLRPTPC
jgi:hypothetical protein